uniref:Peptidase A1 domain-containing protein n=1 Tax=Guillardia theta TaxID=55529 RepID=A0A7S4N8N2_GUITH|mmetsp:Transcript_18407/g.60437  ORF Transcript_18407/g.60437 Transcript_18407/m.60437 type:complete len:470 (+) Transcript_18407:52-1461(+)
MVTSAFGMSHKFCPALLLLVHSRLLLAYDPFQKNVNAPFIANSTDKFHPLQSMSFAHVLFDGFDLKYADTADLRGYIGQDIVQLGHYYARTKFGCITKCDSADFNGVDGILGLGMPDAALASIPEPLFFAITDDTGDPVSQRILRDRKFTFVVDREAGELQLGAYDHKSIAKGDRMHFFKATSTAEYSIPVTSIKFDGRELLDFETEINPRVPGRESWIPGILDSGTSCLVLPDSTLKGVLRDKPFSTFVSLARNSAQDATKKLPIMITIGHGRQSHTFEIPFEDWWLDKDSRPCVQTSPPAFMGILLGDVIFRALVVHFDLTHPTVPVIGLAQRNRQYKPVRPGSNWAKHKPKHHEDFGIPEGFDDGSHTASGEIDKVPLETGLQTQIFINVSIGVPRQTVKVVLDTGSSVFAVFCDKPPKKGARSFAHIYLPHFIPSFASAKSSHRSPTSTGHDDHTAHRGRRKWRP